MAGQAEAPAQGSFFGRLFSRQASDGEPKKKPVKAKLGQKNEFFYDEELKVWRERGKPPPENAGLPPPPPTVGFVSRGASSGEELGGGTGSQGPGSMPLRNWSSGSLEGSLPTPSTPTQATSTYFSGRPSAGSGPAAQAPFRTRNVKPGTANRYAASSLIPTKAGAASAGGLPSAAKPPLAPTSPNVTMFNPARSGAAAGAPGFFVPGGAGIAGGGQAPFFAGTKTGRPPSFGSVTSGTNEEARASGKLSAQGALLSPRDKRPKLDGLAPQESVGDNLAAASLDSNEEVTSPYGAGGPVPAVVDAPAPFGYSTSPMSGAGSNAVPDAFAGDGSMFPGPSDAQGYTEVYGFDPPGYSLESDAAGGDLTATAPYNAYGGAWEPEPPGGTADALLAGSGAEPYAEPLTVGGAEDGFLEDGAAFQGDAGQYAAGEGPAHGGPEETDPFAVPGDGAGGAAGWEADPFAAGDPAAEEAGSILGQPKDSGAFGSTFFPGGSTHDDPGLGSATGSGLPSVEASQASLGYEKALPGSGLEGDFENFGAGVQASHADAAQAGGDVFDSAAGYAGEYDASMGTTQYTLDYQNESYQATYTSTEAGAEGAPGGVVYGGGYTWEQVLEWAEQYRTSGEYSEEQIQEWLEQMRASAAPALQTGWEAGAEAPYESSGVAADSFDAQIYAEPSAAVHQRQSWEQERLGVEGQYEEAGPAGGYGGDGLEGGEAGGPVGDQGFGPGEAGALPGNASGETMVVQEDVTTYYNETYQFNSQGPQGVTQGFGGWAGKFSALTSSTKTTVTTSFMDRVGLGDWLAAKSTEGKITGPLPWDMQSTATSAEGEGDEGKQSAPGSPSPGSPTAEDPAADQAAGPAPGLPSALLPALLCGEPAALAFPPAPRIVPPEGEIGVRPPYQALHSDAAPGIDAAEEAPPQAVLDPGQWQEPASEWSPNAQTWPPPVAVLPKEDGPKFPRTTSMGSQASPRSYGTSVAQNQGTPTSSKSYPAESQAPPCSSLPASPTSRAVQDHEAERWEDAHKGYGTQQVPSKDLHAYPNGFGPAQQEPVRADSGIAREEVYQRDSTGATYGGSSFEAVHQGVSAAFRSRTDSGPFNLGHASPGEALGPQAGQQAHEQEAVQETLGYPEAVQETLGYPEAGQEHLVYPEAVREPDDEEGDSVPPLAARGPVPMGTKPLQRVGSLGAAPPDFDSALLTFVNQPLAAHPPPSPSHAQSPSAARPSPTNPIGAPDPGARSPGTSPRGVTAWSYAEVVELNDVGTVTSQDGFAFNEDPDAQPRAQSQEAIDHEGPDAQAAAEGAAGAAGAQRTATVGTASRPGDGKPQLVDGVLLEGSMQVSPFAAVMGRPLPESSSPSVETESGKSMDAGGFGGRGDWTTGELQMDAGQEIVPRRTSQLRDSEPTLAVWSTEDEAPSVPQARDYDLKGLAASLPPLNVPPSPAPFAQLSLQEELEQLRDRNDDLMAELGDVKVQLDAATSESRKWVSLYFALEDKMEAMARDLSSFQEQKDVLQAQIATLLAEREDEAAAASNDKFEFEELLEEERRAAEAAREEAASLRAHVASLQEELAGAALSAGTAEAGPAGEALPLQPGSSAAREGPDPEEFAAALAEVQSLRDQLAEAARDRTELAAKQALLEEELGSVKAQLTHVAVERDDLVTKNADLVAENVALADDLLAKDEEIEKLQGDVAHSLQQQARAPSQDLLEKLQEATAELAELRSTAEELQRRLAQREAEAAEQLALQEQLSAEKLQHSQEAAQAKLELDASAQLQQDTQRKLEEAMRELHASQTAAENYRVALKAAEEKAQHEAGEKAAEAGKQLQAAARKDTSKLMATLKARTAELKNTRKVVEETTAALEKAKAEAAAAAAERDEAVARALVERTRLEAEREEALALAQAEVQQIKSLSAAPQGSLVTLQAELEVERGLVAQLKQEVAQFKEQSRLDFERIGALAEENQQLQEELELLQADEGGEKHAPLVAERDRLALRCAELEAAHAAGPSDEASALRAELETLRAFKASANDQILSLQRDLESQNALLADFSEAKSAAEERAEAAARSAAETASALERAEVASSGWSERVAALERELAEKSKDLAALQDACSGNALALEEARQREAGLQEAADVALAEAERLRAAAREGEEKLDAALAAARAELSDAKAEADVLSRELGGARAAEAAAAAEWDRERRSLREALASAEEAVRKLQEAAAAREEDEQGVADALREALAAAEAKLEAVTSSGKAEVASLQEALAAAQAELEAVASSGKAEVASLQGALAAAQAELESVASSGKAEVASVREALAAAQAELEAARAERDVALASSGNADGDSRVAELQQRLAEAEAEAENLFARQTELEEEAAAAEGQAAAAMRARDEALARAAHLEALLASAPQSGGEGGEGAEAVKARLAEVEWQLETQQQEHSDLLACLGQESAKLEALIGALEGVGVDPWQILEQVEEEYGFGEKDLEDELEEGDEEHLPGTSLEAEGLGVPSDTSSPENPASMFPHADKGASSGTTSDGSWRVLRAPVDSDWAEVPLDQASQPSSPLAHTGDSAGPGSAHQDARSRADNPEKHSAIPFGKASGSLANAFTGTGVGSSLPADPAGQGQVLDIDSWDTEWSSMDI